MFTQAQRIFTLTGSAIVLAQSGLALAQTPNKSDYPKGDDLRSKWQQADLDRDGQLSKAEAQAAGLKPLTDRFDAIDTNKDGKISEAEFKSAFQGKQGIANSSKDKPGYSAQQVGAARGPEQDGMGFKSPDQRRAEMQERFNKADTNKDGGLSRAELQAAGIMHRVLDNFDAIDSNKDGKVTTEELRAAWEQRNQ